MRPGRLPTEEAATIALRTQQILAFESGVTSTADPLGGSYFLEKLTLDMERGSFAYFDRIDALGGMVEAVEQGFPQREVHDAAYAYQQAVESGKKKIVGVNVFHELPGEESERPIKILAIDEAGVRHQREKLKRVRESRDGRQAQETLRALAGAAEGRENMMPYILNCVRAYATLGEMCDALRQVFGTYQEPAFH